MKNPTLTAKRYAEAFFSLIERNSDKFEDNMNDFNLFSDLFLQKTELYNLLTHPLIHPDRKTELVGRVFSKADKHIISFICVIIKRRKIHLFEAITVEIKRLYRQKKGIRGLIVKTAVPLNNSEFNKLEKVLEKKFGRLSIRQVVDRTVVGGLVIHFGNQVVDDSIHTRIKRLREMLNRIDETWLYALSEQPSLGL
ncbi:MAG: ATP synthase subunit delta [bacterium ADurb.Bin157]|jgi:F-type H+-transporting ATPase subunit delta|nr:MAG: ATP synthase subunit delta [bacterium ADurb.Bin157]